MSADVCGNGVKKDGNMDKPRRVEEHEGFGVDGDAYCSVYEIRWWIDRIGLSKKRGMNW